MPGKVQHGKYELERLWFKSDTALNDKGTPTEIKWISKSIAKTNENIFWWSSEEAEVNQMKGWWEKWHSAQKWVKMCSETADKYSEDNTDTIPEFLVIWVKASIKGQLSSLPLPLLFPLFSLLQKEEQGVAPVAGHLKKKKKERKRWGGKGRRKENQCWGRKEPSPSQKKRIY